VVINFFVAKSTSSFGVVRLSCTLSIALISCKIENDMTFLIVGSSLGFSYFGGAQTSAGTGEDSSGYFIRIEDINFFFFSYLSSKICIR